VLLQGFYRGIWSTGVVHISTSISDVSAGIGLTHARLALSAAGANEEV
jgi:hypothetical protein